MSNLAMHQIKRTDRDILRPILCALSPSTFVEGDRTIYAGWKKYTFTVAGVLTEVKAIGKPKQSTEPRSGLRSILTKMP